MGTQWDQYHVYQVLQYDNIEHNKLFHAELRFHYYRYVNTLTALGMNTSHNKVEFDKILSHIHRFLVLLCLCGNHS